jgi:hypothetical protein
VDLLGICSGSLLTDCDFKKTEFGDSYIDNYFNGPFIATTTFNLLLKVSVTTIPTNLSSLTISVSYVCGDATGKTWCGDRDPIILFFNGTAYKMA